MDDLSGSVRLNRSTSTVLSQKLSPDVFSLQIYLSFLPFRVPFKIQSSSGISSSEVLVLL